jgi:glycosyltransferase involved in cell wall biosynthesis
VKNKVTIVLTTYNRPKFLILALDSILSQTFKNFRLVILDNGSDNETYKLIDSYDDKRIYYIKSDTNNLDFLNKAFTFTQLKYLMITHDDDIMEETLIERHIKKMDSNDQIGLISSSINLIDKEGNKLNKVRPRIKKDKNWSKNEFIEEYFLRGDIIPCPSSMFRSSVIIENNFNYKWKVGPAVDLYLLFKMNLLDHNIYLFKRPLYNYRIHENQDSEKNRISLEYQVRPYIVKLLIKNNLNKYVKKYEQSSLGIILQTTLNNFISGTLSFNNLKKEINRLISEGLRINFISFYWTIIGIIRGVKNFLFR